MSLLIRDRVSALSILGDGLRLARRDWRTATVSVILLTALGALGDGDGARAGLFVLLSAGASLAAQFVVTKKLLQASDAPSDGGFWNLFWVCLVSNIAVLVGLVLFIIPGLIILARWFVVVPHALARSNGGGEAFGESWRLTKGTTFPIAFAILLLYFPFLVLTIASVAAGDEPSAKISQFLATLFQTVAAVWSWHAATAYYLAGTQSTADLEHVFE